MSSHVVVIATDLRRATVKVTPGTYLSDVLEQACKKLNLDESKHTFRHKQKNVDLSIPFRTSGLVGGAKLELVLKANTPSAVQIALQLPQPLAHDVPGGRLIKKFPSDIAIWQILRLFESGDASAARNININITARGVAQTLDGAARSGAGQLYYEMPVLNIMGRELASFPQFQKTMAQLGHNAGNVLIRLSFRKTEQTLYDAMAEIGQLFKEQEREPQQEKAQIEGNENNAEGGQQAAPAQDGPVEDGDTDMVDIAPAAAAESRPEPASSSRDHHAAQPTAPERAHGLQTQTQTQTQTPQSDSPAPQNQLDPVGVFLAPSGSTPAAALAPVSEADFIPTIAHAQLHQQRLQDSSRIKRLLSDKEIQEKQDLERARIAAVKSVLVKVRFPDNTSSDWQIGPADTGAFLYAAVRHVMASPEHPFHLVVSDATTNSNTSIRDDDSQRHSLVKAYRFVGRVLVNLSWEDAVPPEVRKRPFLRASVADQAREVKVQDIPTGGDDDDDEDAKDAKGGSASGASRAPSRDDGEAGAKKVPKWFKLGKK